MFSQVSKIHLKIKLYSQRFQKSIHNTLTDFICWQSKKSLIMHKYACKKIFHCSEISETIFFNNALTISTMLTKFNKVLIETNNALTDFYNAA